MPRASVASVGLAGLEVEPAGVDDAEQAPVPLGLAVAAIARHARLVLDDGVVAAARCG